MHRFEFIFHFVAFKYLFFSIEYLPGTEAIGLHREGGDEVVDFWSARATREEDVLSAEVIFWMGWEERISCRRTQRIVPWGNDRVG
jgi:hypothetical protein